MKVYTEVNYEFKDGSLVELSSQFYNYDGQVVECKSAGKAAEAVAAKTSETIDYADERLQAGKQFVDVNTQSVKEGPGGEWGKAADYIYGGSIKAGVESVQETYRDEETKAKEGFAMLRQRLGNVHGYNPEEEGEEGEAGPDLPETTEDEQESLLTQGLVAEGGRKQKHGRKAMSTGTQASSILAPNTA